MKQKRLQFGRNSIWLKVAVATSTVAISLLVGRQLLSNSYDFWFLLWNLALAWIPLVVALYVSRGWPAQHLDVWRHAAAVVWLLFLPNCFYLVTDLIHIRLSSPSHLGYDATMLASFALAGYVLGYASLSCMIPYLHRLLPKYWRRYATFGLFLLCGFGIYLGRFLRWNSWDVILDPLGLVRDVIYLVTSLDQMMAVALFSVIFALPSALIYEHSQRKLKITSL